MKGGWYASHTKQMKNIIKNQAKVILLGDSLVANLSRYPSVWDRHLGPHNVVNCGIGGDHTQNVLWRVDKMYLPASVSVGVIHCGVNNTSIHAYGPHDIATSIVLCGSRLREINPHIKVIIAVDHTHRN